MGKQSLCEKCDNDCKQQNSVKVVKCPSFKPMDVDKCRE